MISEVLRFSGKTTRLEILRRSDDRETHLLGDSDGNHVPLDELAKLNAGIVLPGYKIDRVIGGSDLQNNFWVGACEVSQLRQNHHLRGCSWDDEWNSACRTLSLLSRFSYSPLNPL
jgi:hypothetical protein